MLTSTEDTMEHAAWGPRAGAIAGCAIIGLAITTAAATLVTDAPGRTLAGVAGLGLIVFAIGSWRASPKLAIRPEGLVVQGWWRKTVLRHADIAIIRVTEFRRLGRKARLLEIDAAGPNAGDDRLLVFTRWDLGVDPVSVLDALTEAGYAGNPGGPGRAVGEGG